jgi:hypothetical protein
MSDLKTSIKTLQAQNRAINNQIQKNGDKDNLNNQKYYYLSSSRIFTSYVLFILKYLYYFVLLVFIITLLYKNMNFYTKLSLILVFITFPFMMTRFYAAYKEYFLPFYQKLMYK